jgi:hypothetical protein
VIDTYCIGSCKSNYRTITTTTQLVFFILRLGKFTAISGEMGRRGRDRMVVGFTTTYAISAYHYWCCEFESRSGRGVQHYVMKFVSDLRQVSGFHRDPRFPSPIKLTATIYNWNIVESGVKHHQANKQTNWRKHIPFDDRRMIPVLYVIKQVELEVYSVY